MSEETTPGPAAPAQSQSLYRKYRPTSFDPSQLVGQEHVARTLRNAIVLDRVAHAYLFCGPRGTGKTSTARLLAKAVNCQAGDPTDRPCNQCESCQAINSGSVVDIIEIDAASNRGVDDIRDLREKVRYAPTQLKVKFYIIDEAHQLTRDAFNAFLKTLEEPPGHVKFVLATTEAEKLPDTVASRCQRFDFRRIPVESALQHLRHISGSEQIKAEEEALLLIARHATGSLRDALGLLDQLALYGDHESDERVLTAETVRQVLGLSHNDRLTGLVRAIADGDAGEGLRLITEATDSGEDIHQINRQMIGYLRLLLHIRAGGRPPEADDSAAEIAGKFSLEHLTSLVQMFTDVDAASNRSSYPQLPLELALVRAIVSEPSVAQRTEVQTLAPPPASPASVAPDPNRAVKPAAQSAPSPMVPQAGQKRTPAATPAPVSDQPARQRSRQPARPTNGMLEHLVANWSHIRRDIKAQNSRIAALLSSADPAAVTDDAIILAAPYEFHRNKLNEDSVRQVIEHVLQQYSHSEHRMICMAPEDVPETSSTVADASEPPDPAAHHNGAVADQDSVDTGSEVTSAEPAANGENSANGVAESDDQSEDTSEETESMENKGDGATTHSEDDPETGVDEQRVDAAKRIFEAREIE